jgi:hypothetical protein
VEGKAPVPVPGPDAGRAGPRIEQVADVSNSCVEVVMSVGMPGMRDVPRRDVEGGRPIASVSRTDAGHSSRKNWATSGDNDATAMCRGRAPSLSFSRTDPG